MTRPERRFKSASVVLPASLLRTLAFVQPMGLPSPGRPLPGSLWWGVGLLDCTTFAEDIGMIEEHNNVPEPSTAFLIVPYVAATLIRASVPLLRPVQKSSTQISFSFNKPSRKFAENY